MDCRVCGTALYGDEAYCTQCMTPTELPPRPPRAEPESGGPPKGEPQAELQPEADDRPKCVEHAEYPQIGTCARCGKFICIRCAPDAATSAQPRCTACTHRESAQDAKLEGLGGWLILVAIQLVLSTLGGLLAGVASVLASRFADAALTFGLGGYCAVTTVLFFMKKKIAPLLMLGFFAANAMLIVFNAANGEIAGLARIIVPIAWCLYVLNSRRVRATFVR